jgi:hypothetical protein
MMYARSTQGMLPYLSISISRWFNTSFECIIGYLRFLAGDLTRQCVLNFMQVS